MAGRSAQAHVDLAMEPVPVQAAAITAEPQNITIDLTPLRHDRGGHAKRLLRTGRMVRLSGRRPHPERAPIKPLQALLPALRKVGVPIVWLNWGKPAPIS